MGVSEMLGLTLSSVDVTQDKIGHDDEIVFKTSCGRTFKMYHQKDCCESVTIEDVCGEFDDLIGVPLLLSEESCSDGGDVGVVTYTWTFYRFSTVKGDVTIRWYGESNGYYSECVDFEEV